jgi:hypothetical protein
MHANRSPGTDVDAFTGPSGSLFRRDIAPGTPTLPEFVSFPTERPGEQPVNDASYERLKAHARERRSRLGRLGRSIGVLPAIDAAAVDSTPADESASMPTDPDSGTQENSQ